MTRKIVEKKLGLKSRENVAVLYFLAVDNVDLTRKIVENNLYVKTRENVAVLYFLAVDNFDLTRKIIEKILVKKKDEKNRESIAVPILLQFDDFFTCQYQHAFLHHWSTTGSGLHVAELQYVLGIVYF